MRIAATFLLAALAVTPLGAEDAKGTKTVFDGLTSTTPATWAKEDPANKMRFAQFKLPKAKGDKEDAELVIFKGLGGSSKDNIARWKKQFTGKTADDAKVTKVKIGGIEADQLEVTGSFLYNPAPFNPASKPVERENYKMIAIHFEGPDNVYHIKLTGPAKTIDLHAKGFKEWIDGFKK